MHKSKVEITQINGMYYLISECDGKENRCATMIHVDEFSDVFGADLQKDIHAELEDNDEVVLDVFMTIADA